MVQGNRPKTRLGIEAENQGYPALDPGVVAMAIAAEAAGVDSISVSDHLLSFAFASEAVRTELDETWLEAFACLAAISSVTARVRLIASVIVLPQRNLLELLKVTSTINVLSEGRLVLGVGSGWNRPEMEALGFDFATRGRRMDEMLEVMRGIDGIQIPSFRGDHIAVPERVVMAPNRRLPIYIGGSGTSRTSLRRAIRYGDGWMPYAEADRFDADALRQSLAFLQSKRSALGKPTLDTIFKLRVRGHADPAMERNVAVLASLGFAEILVQGVWDAGIENGLDAIDRIRRVLDAV